jgi:molybdopterin-guanine dinucleotide biosynthesis protein B
VLLIQIQLTVLLKGEFRMFNRVIVAIVGSSNSGKTTAIEAIIKGLTKKGYKVASAKRIPEPEFTIDTEGKDTWRHAKAGACTVLSVAPKELTTINKCKTKNITLEQLISHISNDTDVIIIEGFKALVGEEMNIPKIVAIKTAIEMSEAINKYKNIIAFIGKAPDKKMQTEIPFINTLKEPEKLVKLVNDKVAVQVERKHKREEKIMITVNEQTLPMGDFVQDIVLL